MSLVAVITCLMAVIDRLMAQTIRLMKIKELEPHIDRIGLEKLNVILENGQIKYFVCWDDRSRNIVVYDRLGIAWTPLFNIGKPENVNDITIETKNILVDVKIGNKLNAEFISINGEQTIHVEEYDYNL